MKKLISLILILTSTLTFAKPLSQIEFETYLKRNNEQGLKYHNNLTVAMVTGDRAEIPKSICALYNLSMDQKRVASSNSNLVGSQNAKQAADANLKNLEESLTVQQRPLSKYCQK